MKRAMILTVLLTVAVATFIGLAPQSRAADPIATTPGTAMTGGLAATLAELDLSDDQKSRIASILKRDRSQIQQQVDALRNARTDLADAIHADSFDEAAVREASAAVATAETEMAVTRARLVQEVRAVLTPEQRDTLAHRRAAARTQISGRFGLVRGLVNDWIDRHAG